MITCDKYEWNHEIKMLELEMLMNINNRILSIQTNASEKSCVLTFDFLTTMIGMD